MALGRPIMSPKVPVGVGVGTYVVSTDMIHEYEKKYQKEIDRMAESYSRLYPEAP